MWKLSISVSLEGIVRGNDMPEKPTADRGTFSRELRKGVFRAIGWTFRRARSEDRFVAQQAVAYF